MEQPQIVQMNPKMQLIGIIFTGLCLLVFGLAFSAAMYFSNPTFLTQIRPDSKGIYKTAFKSGETFYCEAEQAKDGTLIEGQCQKLEDKR